MGGVSLEPALKLAIITGASSGIGAASAVVFLKAGFKVISLARRPSPVAGVTSIEVDLVASYEAGQLEALWPDEVRSADQMVLVHNACAHVSSAAMDTSDAQLRSALVLNLQVPNALNRALIPHMKPSSAILYVGSTLSEKAVPGAFSYIISKHGLVGMMRATTQDLAGTGIHAVCICPGFTDTEMMRQHIGNNAEALSAVKAKNAENRLIQPEEIAETLLFAANNSTLNGAVVHAHLGQIET